MPLSTVPASATGLPKDMFVIGDRVVVEVTGTIEVAQKSRRGVKYIIQPDDPRAASIHASPEYVFPEDNDGEPVEGTIAA